MVLRVSSDLVRAAAEAAADPLTDAAGGCWSAAVGPWDQFWLSRGKSCVFVWPAEYTLREKGETNTSGMSLNQYQRLQAAKTATDDPSSSK